ncbi:uncharacterized protein EAE98_000203 [Botrytis deweyae]|uniref:HNH nuclease domain-containing protein n=1 Tax=Botrytis deweyae TaxID=2478750 RepID=A0ABQ7J242_9HELO|nr:uncharacterized protein EAE98_000203 [Botrytis deweyae]KAF7940076.1 hypothetical protein EAE98_000203 [Botrytis deweyae]
MSPPQISVDIAMTLIRNGDIDFLIGYRNSIPDPRYLTIEQRKDVTPAVLGNAEPHKFIYFHFRKVDDSVRTNQIIMHRYPNARHHDWDNQDDIDKLNVFRFAAITLAITDTDVSVGEKCWSEVSLSLKRMWFPNLIEFVEERRAEAIRLLTQGTIDDDDEDDDEDEEEDEDDGENGDEGIFSGHSEEFEIVADIPEVQNHSNTPVHNATQTALASSSNIPVGSPILNPELSSVSTHSGSTILHSPFIAPPVVDPRVLSIPAEVESLNLNDDPDAMEFELLNSVNNEGHGGCSLK